MLQDLSDPNRYVSKIGSGISNLFARVTHNEVSHKEQLFQWNESLTKSKDNKLGQRKNEQQFFP